MKHLLAFLLLLWPSIAFSADTWPTTFDPTGAGCAVSSGKLVCTGTTKLTASAVNLASTGDKATITIPSYVTAYQITSVKITNCSAIPVLAQVALYTAASAGGTNIVGAAVITGATSASVVLSSTLATAARLTAGTIYINVPVANATALTCDVKLSLDDLS